MKRKSKGKKIECFWDYPWKEEREWKELKIGVALCYALHDYGRKR